MKLHLPAHRQPSYVDGGPQWSDSAAEGEVPRLQSQRHGAELGWVDAQSPSGPEPVGTGVRVCLLTARLQHRADVCEGVGVSLGDPPALPPRCWRRVPAPAAEHGPRASGAVPPGAEGRWRRWSQRGKPDDGPIAVCHCLTHLIINLGACYTGKCSSFKLMTGLLVLFFGDKEEYFVASAG